MNQIKFTQQFLVFTPEFHLSPFSSFGDQNMQTGGHALSTVHSSYALLAKNVQKEQT
jgi:hypothetical protein